MIEIVATFARWSQLVANLIIFGSCVFLAIAGQQRAVFESSWATRLERGFPWMVGVILIGLLGILATTTGEATGIVANTWRPGAWLEIVQQTRVGHMWATRAVFALILLAVILYLQHVYRVRWHYILCAGAAALPLIAGSLVSHSAAEEMSVISILPYALHILLAGIWFGALPAFLLIIFSKKEPDKPLDLLSIESLKKFSSIALPAMVIIIATGVIVADRMIEEDYHALVASSYGWLINIKLSVLAIVLVIAYRARSKWLPLFTQTSNVEQVQSGGEHLKKWVGIEFVLAVILVLLATILANTIPAKHAMVENWPYSFRFSIDATWDEPNVPLFFWSGVALFLMAAGSIWLGIKNNWEKKKKIGIPVALVVASAAVALPPLAIDAYPETYQNTPVPFDAISISNGSVFFAENCTTCHGPQGKGNGIAAKAFNPPPADLLTEPHTARHTAGDFFHWLTYGIAETGMPGFSSNLTEEDRWDVVNYMHAMSRGYQARLLSPQVVAEKPSIGPPIFSYFAHDGSSGYLKDFRQKKNVVLVLFTWPQSDERLEELKAAYSRLSELNTIVLAVPMNQLDNQEIMEIAEDIPFPVVTEGALEIKNSYILYRRTLTHPDILGEGIIPEHLEFLIDRFGYLRARWIPGIDENGWEDINFLTRQLVQLNSEKEILPPPSDHVH
ncbi:MAG TPA: cytochrome C [Nitrosomonas nitrosa]|jgi:putative copper resistance protein D|uniref:Putative copper resistance protein D n=1 Tax=Nitrosomonas nitrosa TaxID=52442 RepID=A0A1I4PWL7_9PROT|nr:CopD family protein [Nitrosomonas nitrosa]PTQ97425.1 putative copper resistance protein D [Nitrosomonas nitrosa]CAE6511428.1 putative copper resistance protein D [Nitrosomonas nitrosa]SFM32222.1 putative copper resistance protein D [Nitrosomonas nitrosa]HBZ30132.1 cytochrome C [Nitrosomonas nitrosa]HNP52137.1 CopD family protein [Nitrosomonas nitrosa]